MTTPAEDARREADLAEQHAEDVAAEKIMRKPDYPLHENERALLRIIAFERGKRADQTGALQTAYGALTQVPYADLDAAYLIEAQGRDLALLRAGIAAERANSAGLRAALVASAIVEEFDYPGDAPESCGFICTLCRATGGKTRETVEHEPTCALSASPSPTPIDLILHCPACHLQHVDEPDERTPDWVNPPHRSHLCHGCGYIWRPADVPTNGVAAIKTRGKNDALSPILPNTRMGEDAVRELIEAARAVSVLAVLPYFDPDGGRESIENEEADARQERLRAALARLSASQDDTTVKDA